MNPFVQFLQMLASGAGAGAGAAGAPAGLLAGGKAAEAAGAVPQAAPAAAPHGLLGGLQGMIGKERGADLMSMGAAMMQAGGTSTDPRSGDFFSALGSGMGAAQNSQTQRADTDLKRAVTQAQIGNYNSSAAQNAAQTDMLRGQAEAMKSGMPVYAGAGAAAAAPTAQPGTAIQSTAPAAPAEQTGPQAGQVYDGFRFKGGNPNDPNAWEKV